MPVQKDVFAGVKTLLFPPLHDTQRGVVSHYDNEYFAWQNTIGKFGGWANYSKFSKEIKKNDRILDFGCGGGWLLALFSNAEKMGIEINDAARAFAKEHNDINAVKYAAEAPDSYFDVVISNHALEHCERPLDELRTLYKKLKPQGKITVVVPCEHWKNRWKKNDRNMHIYTWNPMTLGNIFSCAGFSVQSVIPLLHKWPPYYAHIARLGRFWFDVAAHIYGRIMTDIVQIKIVALKE